ncbi:MAG: class I SAM-dependent methyltransferase [Pseudomonadota bacterium]
MVGNSRLWHPWEEGVLDELSDQHQSIIWRAKPDPGLQGRPVTAAIQSFKPDAKALQSMGLTLLETGQNLDIALVEITRSKPETFGNIAEALTALKPGGWCVVDGVKTDGIDSVTKSLKSHFDIDGSYSKAHGRVVWFQRPDQLPPIVADWANVMTPTEVEPGYVTVPGIFSEKGADAGSKFLLDHIPQSLSGKLADLGAGWGWLSGEALKQCPDITEIHLFEAEGKALDCARKNVTDPRASFHWTDVTREALGQFDIVIMNPPFHTSRTADPQLGIKFITAAAAALHRGGTLYMVANRQLPYEAELDRRFAKWDEIATSQQYKIIVAKRPKGK